MAIFWAIVAPFMGSALLGQMLEQYIPGAENFFSTIGVILMTPLVAFVELVEMLG